MTEALCPLGKGEVVAELKQGQEEMRKAITDLTLQVKELTIRMQTLAEAEAKRDNQAVEIGVLKERIEDLRGMVRGRLSLMLAFISALLAINGLFIAAFIEHLAKGK